MFASFHPVHNPISPFTVCAWADVGAKSRSGSVVLETVYQKMGVHLGQSRRRYGGG